MNIQLHIERLVLDGLPLTRREGALVQAAVETELARLNLTGGNIHTVALNAAFLAAQGQTPVHMGSVLSAARVEMTKLERPVNEADFFWPIGSL